MDDRVTPHPVHSSFHLPVHPSPLYHPLQPTTNDVDPLLGPTIDTDNVKKSLQYTVTMSRPQDPAPKRDREHHNPQPPKPQGGVDPKVARAAALAAAEARLRPPNPPTSPTDPSTSTSNTNTSGPSSTTPSTTTAGGAANAKIDKWQPSEKGDGEKRKEYQRLLYRGVVRDNGYKQASECVEVSPPFPFLCSLSLFTTLTEPNLTLPLRTSMESCLETDIPN